MMILKGSTLPADRKKVCEPLSLEIHHKLFGWIEAGQITMEEALDIIKGLEQAYSLTVKVIKAGLVGPPNSH